MVQIAFLLLCHRDPDAVVAQAQSLTSQGDCVVIHFDAAAGKAAFQRLQTALKDTPRVALVPRRVHCGWGEWSLVEATLRAARLALSTFPKTTHVHMVSGDCMPIKPAAHLRDALHERSVDYIESVDFYDGGWIKTGLHEDRLVYRHWVNERDRKWLFYQSLGWQKHFGLRRELPSDLRIMIGSQWWCLRRATLQAVLDFCDTRADVLRFFRTTWIPDETFFQTLVRHLVPRTEIVSKPPTFLQFTDYGMPANFYDDHVDFLLAQDAFFARKIGREASALRAALTQVWASDAPARPITGDGHRLHAFLTNQGREGRRFARRAWERGANLSQGETVILLACKRWHIGKRLAHAVQPHISAPVYDYVFDEDSVDLPDLGGIERTKDSRTHNRPAFLRLLLDAGPHRTIALCIDTDAAAMVADLAKGPADIRVLEIACPVDDPWLRGHAERIGLAGRHTDAATWDQILPPLGRSVRDEAERLATGPADRYARIDATALPEANAPALARVLEISEEQARTVLASVTLRDD